MASNNTTTFTGHGITLFSLNVIKVRLGLEIKGLKGRGQTMYALCKERYGLRGTKAAVYTQLCSLIESETQKLQAGDVTQS